jgi:hypothetical protein
MSQVSIPLQYFPGLICGHTDKREGKGIPVTGREGPLGCETSRL